MGLKHDKRTIVVKIKQLWEKELLRQEGEISIIEINSCKKSKKVKEEEFQLQ